MQIIRLWAAARFALGAVRAGGFQDRTRVDHAWASDLGERGLREPDDHRLSRVYPVMGVSKDGHLEPLTPEPRCWT